MVFVSAACAMRRQLAAGHSNEWACRPVNDLKIPYNETIVESDGAKSSQAIIRVLRQFDAYFRYFHASLPTLSVVGLA